MASDAESLAKRQFQIFDHLVEAGQWARVLEMGPRLLCDDPENGFIHNMVTIAALELKDYDMAKRHSEIGIQLEPGEAVPHRLRARYLRSINRPLLAKASILEALRLEPEDASIWGEYGWNCYERGDLHTARKACETARSLAPEDLGIELLEISVEGAIDDPERLSAYDQIEAYEKSLRLDPECSATFFNIGTTYLHQLDDGRNAAEWLRKATAIEPQNVIYQKELQKAICRCDPILKVINSPVHLMTRCGWFIENYRAKHPYGIIFALPILIPACFVGMILGGLWAAFLYLPGHIYRLLAWSEILAKATGGERVKNGIYALPIWVRVIVFFLLSIPLSYSVYWLFTNSKGKVSPDFIIGGGMILGMLIGIYFSAKKRESDSELLPDCDKPCDGF